MNRAAIACLPANSSDRLDRSLKYFRHDSSSFQLRRSSLERTLGALFVSLRHLVAKRQGKLCFLPPADIDSVVAKRNYVVIHARGKTYSTRWTMKDAEAALEPFSFMRVHRSILLNIAQVRTIERTSPGRYLFTLNGGQQHVSGRNYSRQMRELLSNPVGRPQQQTRGKYFSGTSSQ